MNEVEMDQINVLENMLKFDNKSKPRPKKVRLKKYFLVRYVLFMKVEN